MKTRYFSWSVFLLLAAALFGSCSDWLDVKPESEEREKDLFSSYQGFKDALSGCYATMAGTDLYGKRLTMSDIEDMACLWSEPSQSQLPEDYYFYHHLYTATETESAIKAIYGGLFNVVAQANKILEHVNDGVITDADARNVVEGEALALRAYCQFDVLRLFGQMPQNAKKTVRLPYATKTGINEQAAWYGFDDYVKMLQDDLSRAEELLGQSDPILKYDIFSLNNQGSTPANLMDDFMQYRQFRLNYFAVKGMEARLALYIGDRATAYKDAMAVINAKVNGEPFMELAGTKDLGVSLNGSTVSYGTLPDECIFALSNRKLSTYAFSLLGGGDVLTDENTMLHITTNMLDKQLYNGHNTTSDNRYLYWWNHDSHNVSSIKIPALKKYYYNTADYTSASSYSTLLFKIQLMPMMRLSELYLIAMESTDDLAEANSLYTTYMASHNVNAQNAFTSLDAVKTELEYEYTREFYGEGQTFYAYKRWGVQWMLFGTSAMSDDQYVLPLPTTEYDPNGTVPSSTSK